VKNGIQINAKLKQEYKSKNQEMRWRGNAGDIVYLKDGKD
jgi:hypothetical protein